MLFFIFATLLRCDSPSGVDGSRKMSATVPKCNPCKLPPHIVPPPREPAQSVASSSDWSLVFKLVLCCLAARGGAIAALGVTIETSTLVPKSRAAVWEPVYKMREWGRWQSVFSIDLEGQPAEGKMLQVTCNWKNGAVDVSTEKIVVVERRRRLCWDWQDGPDWALGTDRCITLADEAKGTRVVNYLTFSGPLAPLVYWFKGGVIADGFESFNRELLCKLSPRSCK